MTKTFYTWDEVVKITLDAHPRIYSSPFGDYENDKFILTEINISDIPKDNYMTLKVCKELDLDENESVIRRLIKAIQTGNELPPIIVNHNNEMIDGSHRTGAMYELGYKTTKVFKRII